MQIIVRSRSTAVSNALHEYTVERVRRALHSLEDRVERIEVVFVDLNGTRRALGQACRIYLELAGGGTLVLQSTARDYYAAASQAAFRVGRYLARTVSRARRLPRRVEPVFATLGAS